MTIFVAVCEREERRYSNGEISRDRAKTRSVFERCNIVSECDLVAAARKLSTVQPVPPASNREDGPASTKPRSGEVGHSSGTVEPDRGPRVKVSL